MSEPQDARDAHAEHEADREPTPTEEHVADEAAADVPDEVGEHFDEMAKLGAQVKGEGEVAL